MLSSLTFEGVSIPHVVRGETRIEPAVEYEAGDGAKFATPALKLDELVWPRTEPLPLAETPIAEIVDLLAAAGDALRVDAGGFLTDALNGLVGTSPYEQHILENAYEDLWMSMSAERLWAQIQGELGGPEVIDGWRAMTGPEGRSGRVRAYPTRMIHVMAGNAPTVASLTVVRGALSKGVHLLKLPSNDLLTATAILRVIADIAPDHPVVQSFSAVYWRGGDTAVESVLFRPQFFDKLVAWGGESAIRNSARFLGPGFELISFDPKNSISMLGSEALESDGSIAEAAEMAAADATPWNQEACTSSRYQFIEGDLRKVDRFCEALQVALGKERRFTSAKVDRLPVEIEEAVESMRFMEPSYRVFGKGDGRGLVVRSDEPVEFFPSCKTVNVVRVPSLSEAVKYVTVATQTVGIHPMHRKSALCGPLAAAGVQRIVPLGRCQGIVPGFPHDGFYPLQRFVRWVADED